MSFRLGLTGSIGMGKSTTAAMFADEGCAIWDADAAVHRLYSADGAAVGPISALFSDVLENGAVSRDALRRLIQADATALPRIESIVHPLVRQDRETFVEVCTSDIVVFDIPLLFETGGETDMDAVACVSVSPEVQELRVLARGTMTSEQFKQIRARQMPNAQKVARSDYVIETDTVEHARAKVQEIVKTLRSQLSHA